MKFLVTGKNGYVGRHVVTEILKQDHEVRDSDYDAVIHLAWRGLPNYESTIHYENVWHQVERLTKLADSGVKNITVAGTCLEVVPNPPHYAKAKLAILDALHSHIYNRGCALKWVRLFHIYGGEGERPERLVPQLKRAIERGQKRFSVIDGERDFMPVSVAARYLVRAALQTEVTGIIDCCSGGSVPVADFCDLLRREHSSPIRIVKDYPLASYEPRVIKGNPAKLAMIL